MKCASYTRKLSNDPRMAAEPNSIGIQKEHITAYIRSRGWQLKKSYSDRKAGTDEIDAFLEMKRDACIRLFGCLVMDSIYSLGGDAFKSIHYIRETLYPSGIHFAVVEDDFCSDDHTAQEVYTYLEDKRLQYFGLFTKLRMNDSSIESYFSTYGFKYIKDEMRVVIDETTAAVVREIYIRLKAGEKPSRIAADLTARGIENPGDYFCRQRGWPLRMDHSRDWNSKSIRTISTNPKYMGKWECGYDSDTLNVDCGAIVEPELFHEVQNVIASRYHQEPTRRVPCPFSRMIFDKGSGIPLRYFCNSRSGKADIRFQYPKDRSVRYKKAHMLYTDFTSEAARLLADEKTQAESALKFIESEEGKSLVQALVKKERDKFKILLEKMSEHENCRMDAYRRFTAGDICETEYNGIVSENNLALERLDDEAQVVAAAVAEIQIAFSAENPWIKLFLTYDSETELSREVVTTYTDRFLISEFETVDMIPREQNWKEYLEQGNREEGCYGPY